MAHEFIYCPRCGKSRIEDADWDDDSLDGRECLDCGWEGNADELVCADDDDKKD